MIHLCMPRSYEVRFGVMVFNATFNNISVISWRSVLLVEETGVHGKKHRSVASHWQTLPHNVVSSTPRHERNSNSQLKIVVIVTYCIGSGKSKYHTITTTPQIYNVNINFKIRLTLNNFIIFFYQGISNSDKTWNRFTTNHLRSNRISSGIVSTYFTGNYEYSTSGISCWCNGDRYVSSMILRPTRYRVTDTVDWHQLYNIYWRKKPE